MKKLQLFDQNHGPLCKNANFVGFSNRFFFCSERLVCYIKRRKSFLHNFVSRSMTCEYRGLQGVTWGYQRLQGVTRGYRGLQGVTKGYMGLQGVTRGDRGLQGITGGYKKLYKLSANQNVPRYFYFCLLYTSPSPRDATLSRMPSSA